MAALPRRLQAFWRGLVFLFMMICAACQVRPGDETRRPGEGPIEIHGGEYLVIADQVMESVLEPLLTRRAAEGLVPKFIPSEVFSYHQENMEIEAEGIRQYLVDAYTHWEIRPRYVLLVGDYQYSEGIGGQATSTRGQIPTYMIKTGIGLSAPSDVMFGMLVDDLSPTIAVGRIPSNNPDEVGFIVEKILDYEDGRRVGKPAILTLVDADDFHYSYDADQFNKYLEGSRQIIRVELISALPVVFDQSADGGTDWYDPIQYFGHGSLRQWGATSYMEVGNAELMIKTNGNSILFQWTCLTGYFVHPTASSLSEWLLIAKESKIAAVFAPTGMTDPTELAAIYQAVAEAMKTIERGRLGDYILAAQRTTYGTSLLGNEIVLTYVLLGDPAMKVNW